MDEFFDNIPKLPQSITMQKRKNAKKLYAKHSSSDISSASSVMSVAEIQDAVYSSVASAGAGFNVPKFTQKEEQSMGLELWLEMVFERFCMAVRATDSTKIDWLSLALTGVARLKFENILKEYDTSGDVSYWDIKEKLIETVRPPDYFLSVRQRLRDCVIDLDNVVDSTWQWKKLCDIAYPEPSPDEERTVLIPLFLQALPPQYYLKVKERSNSMKTLDDAIQKVLDHFNSFNAGRMQRARYEKLAFKSTKIHNPKFKQYVNKVCTEDLGYFNDSDVSNEENSDPTGDVINELRARLNALEAAGTCQKFPNSEPKFNQASFTQPKVRFSDQNYTSPVSTQAQTLKTQDQFVKCYICNGNHYMKDCTKPRSVQSGNSNTITIQKDDLEQLIKQCVRSVLEEEKHPKISRLSIETDESHKQEHDVDYSPYVIDAFDSEVREEPSETAKICMFQSGYCTGPVQRSPLLNLAKGLAPSLTNTEQESDENSASFDMVNTQDENVENEVSEEPYLSSSDTDFNAAKLTPTRSPLPKVTLTKVRSPYGLRDGNSQKTGSWMLTKSHKKQYRSNTKPVPPRALESVSDEVSSPELSLMTSNEQFLRAILKRKDMFDPTFACDLLLRDIASSDLNPSFTLPSSWDELDLQIKIQQMDNPLKDISRHLYFGKVAVNSELLTGLDVFPLALKHKLAKKVVEYVSSLLDDHSVIVRCLSKSLRSGEISDVPRSVLPDLISALSYVSPLSDEQDNKLARILEHIKSEVLQKQIEKPLLTQKPEPILTAFKPKSPTKELVMEVSNLKLRKKPMASTDRLFFKDPDLLPEFSSREVQLQNRRLEIGPSSGSSKKFLTVRSWLSSTFDLLQIEYDTGVVVKAAETVYTIPGRKCKDPNLVKGRKIIPLLTSALKLGEMVIIKPESSSEFQPVRGVVVSVPTTGAYKFTIVEIFQTRKQLIESVEDSDPSDEQMLNEFYAPTDFPDFDKSTLDSKYKALVQHASFDVKKIPNFADYIRPVQAMQKLYENASVESKLPLIYRYFAGSLKPPSDFSQIGNLSTPFEYGKLYKTQFYAENKASLDADALAVVKNSLIKTLTLCNGPPGTGKTKLCAAVVTILSQIDTSQDKKILICTPSNGAADQILTYLLDTVPVDLITRLVSNSKVNGSYRAETPQYKATVFAKAVQPNHGSIHPYLC